MKYRSFKDKKISLLGFGAMRFPTIERDGERVKSISDISVGDKLDVRLFDGILTASVERLTKKKGNV